jgi:Uma2 family endonuclease
MIQAPFPADPLLTAEEYAELPDDGPDELVRGRVVREPQPKYVHGVVQGTLIRLLAVHIEQQRLPLACVGPIGFVVERAPDTVRGPDVAVVHRETALRSPGFIEGAPALAIEIASPSNSRTRLKQKVREYMAAGAVRVWVVYPRARSVAVHRPDGSMTTCAGTDLLDCGDILPHLDIRCAQVFADLE